MTIGSVTLVPKLTRQLVSLSLLLVFSLLSFSLSLLSLLAHRSPEAPHSAVQITPQTPQGRAGRSSGLKLPATAEGRRAFAGLPSWGLHRVNTALLEPSLFALALSEMAKVNVHKGVNTPVLREKERKEEEKEEKAGLKKCRRICPPFCS